MTPLSRGLAIACLFWPAWALPADDPGLPQQVRAVLDRHGVNESGVSIVVREIGAKKSLLSLNAGEPRNPASTIKLLTTWLALEDLGPAYKWPTEAYLAGPLSDGKLDGDLIVKGYGDPYLITERLWGFQRKLKQRGLRHIGGDFVIDNSYFENEYGDPGEFDGKNLRSYNVAPDAFLVNFQAMHMVYEPDPVNNKVNVLIDPLPANLTVENRLKLVNGFCGGYQNGISVVATEAVRRNHIVLSGDFGRGCEQYKMTRSALTAPSFAFGVFKGLWEESGGTLAGGWREDNAPEAAEPFVRIESPPLSDVIEYVNKFSNNVMARHLLLTLGAVAFDPPATLEKGRRAIRESLNRRGLAFDGLHVDNGAGLSRMTRIKATDLAEIMLLAAESPWAPEYISSFSLSGLDGTMEKRFADEEMTGRMHLKTGRLRDVFATAGYVHARSGKDYAVVILQNFRGADNGPGEAAQIALLRWVYEQ